MTESNADIHVPPGALADIAKGISLAHSEMKDLGMIGESTVGRGFSELALSGLELGHGGLASEFGTFCDRWEWGVQALTLKGNVVAQALGLSVGSFAEQERYVKDSLKIVVNSANGNPHLSEDEVKKMSWDTIRDQRAWDNPDYSPESFKEANQEIKQTWKNTTYDVGDAMLDSMERSGMVDPEARDRFDEHAKEALDPDQATVDQAEQPRWGESR
ncbi:hypothetical protein [Streptomyces apocyni]|uniref:hypothetical protein n=1 Tax=Streptomyces apocyni TaxID=2654677 RepID=UPI0012EAA9A0|nr:hypothetical protein [Streptomyces apocyni]